MTRGLAVVGGVYYENCLRPSWVEVYGSAGRATAAVAALDCEVELYSYFDEMTHDIVKQRSALDGASIIKHDIPETVSFRYVHGLDTPRITIPNQNQSPIEVKADNILRFGMLEGDAVVHGNRVVFDPQNVYGAADFYGNGSTANELALVLNETEARSIIGDHAMDVCNVATALIKSRYASVLVIKRGAMGALVHDGQSMTMVHAYRSETVWPIGSGDNFAAHFSYWWALKKMSPQESATLASKATAYYCGNKGFIDLDTLTSDNFTPIAMSRKFSEGKKPSLYLAGPFFTLAQLWMVDEIRRYMNTAGFEVFSPYHDVGYGHADEVVKLDLQALDKSDFVFAIADGLDAGTIYEVGYARAKGKPVVVYAENVSKGDIKMMEGSDCELCNDFVSAIYHAIWIGMSI